MIDAMSRKQPNPDPPSEGSKPPPPPPQPPPKKRIILSALDDSDFSRNLFEKCIQCRHTESIMYFMIEFYTWAENCPLAKHSFVQLPQWSTGEFRMYASGTESAKIVPHSVVMNDAIEDRGVDS
jgi:hypothetical protein